MLESEKPITTAGAGNVASSWSDKYQIIMVRECCMVSLTNDEARITV